MKLVDAKWTPSVNLLLVNCHCGNNFWHYSNKWLVRCPACHSRDNLHNLRNKYQTEASQ